MEKNKQKRKEIPLYSGLIKYFPDALCDREKSKDDLDALMRHLMENGMYDIDGVRHTAKIAWRALAHLQKEIEGDKFHSEQWRVEQYNRNRHPSDHIIAGTE